MSMVRLEERMTNYRPGPEPTRTRREWDTAAAVEERAASDDEFAAQVERCYQPLCRMLRRRFGHSISSVDDLARDVVVQALKDRSHFDPARGTLRNWFWGIARHLVLRWKRHRLETVSIGDPGIEEALFDRAPGPAEQYEAKRRQRALLKSLRRLPDRQRRAVVLYYAREFTVTDTARSLKVSRMQAFRAAKTGLLALKKDLRL